jgi:hypothetical protein
MKIDIAFDVDDVMVRFFDPVLEILKSRGYEYAEKGEYDIEKSVTPKISRNELYEIFNIVYSDPYSIPIVDGAAELCTRLYLRTGDPILFITSRSIEKATETHQLVERFCRVPYVLAFSNMLHNKILFLKDINYFVEDRRKIAMDLAENGKTVFIPIRGWNKISEDFEHIDSIVYIDDVGDLLNNINLLIK